MSERGDAAASRERNERRAGRLAVVAAVPGGAVVAVVVTAVLLVLAPVLVAVLVGPVVGACAAAASVVAVRQRALDAVIGATGARAVAPDELPRLDNVVSGLCVGIGLAEPSLWVVEDPVPNVLSAAGADDRAALVVTTGLVAGATLIELEAVVAHELARIRRGDALVGAVAAVCLGGGALRAGGAQVAPALLPAVWAAPLTRAVVVRGAPTDDEVDSDMAAIDITRYPPGLARALGSIGGEEPSSGPGGPAVAPLWLLGTDVTGSAGDALGRVYPLRRPLGQRIEVLQEL